MNRMPKPAEPVREPIYSRHLAEMTSPLHLLSPPQQEFVAYIVKGVPPSSAARAAGYAINAGGPMLKTPKIQAAVRWMHKQYEAAAQMTRKKVMDGMLEAIDMAKIQADSGNMIAGWREIGRMCGYYAPEVKKVEVSYTGRRVIEQLETLSDADLLRMVEENAQALEGEATRVLEAAPNENRG